MIKPVRDYLLIELIEESQTPSGLFIPTQNEPVRRGTVIAVGPGATQTSLEYKLDYDPGDIVLFSPLGANVLTVNGKKQLLVREADIFAKEA